MGIRSTAELEAMVRTVGYKASFIAIPGPNPEEQVWAGGAAPPWCRG